MKQLKGVRLAYAVRMMQLANRLGLKRLVAATGRCAGVLDRAFPRLEAALLAAFMLSALTVFQASARAMTSPTLPPTPSSIAQSGTYQVVGCAHAECEACELVIVRATNAFVSPTKWDQSEQRIQPLRKRAHVEGVRFVLPTALDWPLAMRIKGPNGYGPARVFATRQAFREAAQNKRIVLACREEGAIRGVLKDPTGQPIAFAYVASLDPQAGSSVDPASGARLDPRARGFNGETSRVARTNRDGEFELLVPDASHELELFLMRAGRLPLLLSTHCTPHPAGEDGESVALVAEPDDVLVQLDFADELGAPLDLAKLWDAEPMRLEWFSPALQDALLGQSPWRWTVRDAHGVRLASSDDWLPGSAVGLVADKPVLALVGPWSAAMRLPRGATFDMDFSLADGRHASAHVQVEGEFAMQRTIQFKAPTQRVELTVRLDPHDVPVNQTDIGVQTPLGVSVASWVGMWTCMAAPDDPLKGIVFPALPPGSYRILVSNRSVWDGRTQSQVLEVQLDREPVELVVDLEFTREVRLVGPSDSVDVPALVAPIVDALTKRAHNLWKGSVLENAPSDQVLAHGVLRSGHGAFLKLIVHDQANGIEVLNQALALDPSGTSIELAPGHYIYAAWFGDQLVGEGEVLVPALDLNVDSDSRPLLLPLGLEPAEPAR